MKTLIQVSIYLFVHCSLFGSELHELKSELFKMGKLIYYNEFYGSMNRKFWGQQGKDDQGRETNFRSSFPIQGGCDEGSQAGSPFGSGTRCPH